MVESNLVVLNKNNIKQKIHIIRNQQVILDKDLALFYKVDTRTLNQAVKRNISRFPKEFMFKLNSREIDLMVSQNVIPSKMYLGGASPSVFTEQGVAMISGVLKTKTAINISVKIINAFCHRDYWKYDSVNIVIFKNRVEVRSPGLLYHGLTIKKIRTELVSERRNEKIAELFHLVHYVERWGRGINLILSKEPETEFKEVGSQFIVVFKRKISSKETVENRSEKSSEKILALIKVNSLITARELSIDLKISSRAIEKQISKLRFEGKIRRVGPDKGGHWEIISK